MKRVILGLAAGVIALSGQSFAKERSTTTYILIESDTTGSGVISAVDPAVTVDGIDQGSEAMLDYDKLTIVGKNSAKESQTISNATCSTSTIKTTVSSHEVPHCTCVCNFIGKNKANKSSKTAEVCDDGIDWEIGNAATDVWRNGMSSITWYRKVFMATAAGKAAKFKVEMLLNNADVGNGRQFGTLAAANDDRTQFGNVCYMTVEGVDRMYRKYSAELL